MQNAWQRLQYALLFIVLIVTLTLTFYLWQDSVHRATQGSNLPGPRNVYTSIIYLEPFADHRANASKKLPRQHVKLYYTIKIL